MTAEGSRPRRTFTPEYKARVVEWCRTGGKSVADVAKEFELSESVLRRWLRPADIDAGERDGLTTAEREELARLRKEVKTLRQERDILKRDAGLSGQLRRRSRRTTLADPSHHAVAPDRVQRAFTPSAALNRVWVGDITYLRTGAGWAYLATVLDLASRRVVGFAVADHLRTSLVTEAFRMAVTARRPQPGLVFHSDRGSQYTSREFKDLLAQHGTVSSLSRPHPCWDNAVAESFFSSLKNELVHHCRFADQAEARSAVFAWIEGFYNRRRIHSTLDFVSPSDYEARNELRSQTCPENRG